MVFFTDGKDLQGTKEVKDIKYMKVLRSILRAITAWPEKEIELKESKYHIYKKIYTFFIESVCLLPGILYLKMNVNEITFFELGHTYITVFMNTVAVFRLTMIFQKKYFETVRYFVKVMHLFNFEEQSAYAIEMQLLVHKICHFFTMLSSVQMFIGILMFNGTPLYNNIISGAYSNYRGPNVTFDQAVYYALPFDYQHNFYGYLVVFFFNLYISFICTSCICIFDLLMSVMVFHVWGHIKILIDNLERFPRPHLEEGVNFAIYSDTEMKEIYHLLRKSIHRHLLIQNFITKMTDTFGPTLFIYFLFQQATGCLLLLECSQMFQDPRSLTRYGPMTVIFFQQVIQISVVFELLGTLGQALSDAVYNVPWECMNKKNRKIVYVFLQHSQKPMNLKALNMVTVGVQTMAMVLKTSISYYIMLRSLADLE